MKSRRLIASPEAQDKGTERAQTSTLKEGEYAFRRRPAHVRFGSKADICGAQQHVCFTPESDAECVHSNVRLEARRSTE